MSNKRLWDGYWGFQMNERKDWSKGWWRCKSDLVDLGKYKKGEIYQKTFKN